MKKIIVLLFISMTAASAANAIKPNGKCRISCPGGSASCEMIEGKCHCTCD
jgi:hypothetical protein